MTSRKSEVGSQKSAIEECGQLTICRSAMTGSTRIARRARSTEAMSAHQYLPNEILLRTHSRSRSKGALVPFLSGGGEPESVRSVEVTHEVLGMLGATAALGRSFGRPTTCPEQRRRS